MFASGGHRARGHNHNAVARRVLLRTLTNQFHHVRPIQPAGAAGENAGTQLDH
jgi:hypothetical protein